MIQLLNISKSYKKKSNLQQVLNNISLSFNENGFVSILGPSGCGKTTLLNIIGLLDTIDEGTFLIDGKDTTTLSKREKDAYRNSKVGFVFQNFNLINHLTVYDNVVLALKLANVKQRKEKVYSALEKVGLQGKENKKPTELSGGELQRVAIARALVNNPEIILADEPTGSLDSKTSIEVVNLLKEISKNKLVIMVTHNEEIAEKYSDRIIKLSDGKVISDVTYNTGIESRSKEINKVHMTFLECLKHSLKNISTKIFRTIATVFAGSIGIVAVLLVITLSNGVSSYVTKLQENALKDKPIIITSNTIYSYNSNKINVEEYPGTNEIYVNHNATSYEHNNNMNEKIVDMIRNLDANHYDIIDYSRTIRFVLYKNNNKELKRIYTSYFTEMNEENVMNYEYDVISGKMPQEYNEIALVVDRYNSINANILKSLGLEYELDFYNFDDIIGQEYFLIENNDMYEYVEDSDTFKSKMISINNETKKLKIVGIIRESANNNFDIYQSGIIYTKKLTDYIKNSAENSEIGKAQLNNGINRNVFTGKEFEDRKTDSVTYSKEYLYEEQLKDLSLVEQINRVEIYTKTFEDRKYIEETIKNSKEFKSISNITYRDYMSSMAEEFSKFVKILTTVLLVFGLISLLVSTIMITTITYISVLERQKEIGILRCIGARQIDVVSIFCSENFIIGILSGFLGVILAYILKNPINRFVGEILKENISFVTSVTNVNLVNFDALLILILVIGNVIITLLAGLVPAIMASIKNPINALKSE